MSRSNEYRTPASSVIGRVFPERLLRDVHPIEADRRKITDHLRILRLLDLTPLEVRELPDVARAEDDQRLFHGVFRTSIVNSYSP